MYIALFYVQTINKGGIMKETYKIQLKGITHDFIDACPAYDPNGETINLSLRCAECKVKAMIKAGRNANSIRIVKE